MTQKELTVLMVEPGKHPKVTKLKDDLDSLQKAVSIGADYQGLIEFVIFATKTRRPLVGGRGEEHPFDRRYGLYDRFCEKPSSPALDDAYLISYHSIVSKMAKTPGFPTKTGTQGIFHSFQAIQIHLQLFTPILVALAAHPPPEKSREFVIGYAVDSAILRFISDHSYFLQHIGLGFYLCVA